MNNQELKKQAQTSAPQIKIAGGLWVMAMMIVLEANVTWSVISVTCTRDYYAFSKGARAGRRPVRHCWLTWPAFKPPKLG